MKDPAAAEITGLLALWRGGDASAEERLWPLVYADLRRVAHRVLRGGRAREGTTSLVHEAFLRLQASDARLSFADRGHFFAIATRAMRFILVDEARRRLSRKREGEAQAVALPEEEPADPIHHRPEDVLAIHQALERLGRIHPRYERLVEARYFAGFSVDETAELLEVSRPTVVREWRAARVWLFGQLQSQGSGQALDAG